MLLLNARLYFLQVLMFLYVHFNLFNQVILSYFRSYMRALAPDIKNLYINVRSLYLHQSF